MIERNNEKMPYTIIKNRVLNSGFLTLEELGLYIVMLSKPDNWEFSEFVLARELGTTPSDVHGILKRLEQKGFTRERKGRYGTVWDLFELSDQLPAHSPVRRRNYTIPQDTAKAMIERLMSAEKAVNQPISEEPVEQIVASPDEGERTMTNEEMAKVFFAQAEKLRKIAAEKKGNALPNT